MVEFTQKKKNCIYIFLFCIYIIWNSHTVIFFCSCYQNHNKAGLFWPNGCPSSFIDALMSPHTGAFVPMPFTMLTNLCLNVPLSPCYPGQQALPIPACLEPTRLCLAARQSQPSLIQCVYASVCVCVSIPFPLLHRAWTLDQGCACTHTKQWAIIIQAKAMKSSCSSLQS